MKAFSNDKQKKQFFIDRMDAHIEADELIKGETWENGKGCFIGCSFHEYSHAKFEAAGIGPEWLAHLADVIFEGLSSTDAQEFAKNFYRAIPVGANLSNIKTPFLIFVMEKNLKTLGNLNIHKKKHPDVFLVIKKCKSAVKKTIKAHKNQKGLTDVARSAESATKSAGRSFAQASYNFVARAASWSAWYAARSAEESVEELAERLPEAVAESAKSAVWATSWAAWSAEESAEESVEGPAVWSAAESAEKFAAGFAAYKEIADKLIQLIKNCGEEK